jgi:hypothetical protein
MIENEEQQQSCLKGPSVLPRKGAKRTSKTSWTYPSRAEANKDREQQQSLVSALHIAQHHLHLDESGAWCIHGDTGKVYTWGDGKSWVVFITTDSGKHWAGAKKKLSFMPVTQDGDDEGCLKLEHPPTPKQAKLIREAVGIRKSPSRKSQDRPSVAVSIAN